MSEIVSFVIGVVIGAALLANMMAGGIETATERGFFTVSGKLYLITPAKPTASP